MKILVCIKEVVDTKLSLDAGLNNRVIFHEGLPLRLNAYDAAALAIALELKSATKDVEITLVSIGGAEVESYLRNGLALGADKAIRIRDGEFKEMLPRQKSLLLAGAASLYSADLVLTGASSLDTGNGITGQMTGARLGFTCVCNAVRIDIDEGQKSITVIKDMGRGEREKIECPLPAVITVKGEGKLPYASLDTLIDSKYSEITLLSPADLGVSETELKNEPYRVTGLVQPRPEPVKMPPLDSSLPAFYRILQLLQGGIAKRKAQMLSGSSEEIAEKLYRLFLEEGVLQPKSAGSTEAK
jgi:electron transfer flavoprotein beta subunit